VIIEIIISIQTRFEARLDDKVVICVYNLYFFHCEDFHCAYLVVKFTTHALPRNICLSMNGDNDFTTVPLLDDKSTPSFPPGQR